MGVIRSVAIVAAGTVGRRLGVQSTRAGMPCRLFDVMCGAFEDARPEDPGRAGV